MPVENSVKKPNSSEIYGLMPDGSLLPVTKRTSKLLVPVAGLSMLVCVGILGLSQMKSASAQGNLNDIKLTPESTVCAQVIWWAINPATNLPEEFNTPCDAPKDWAPYMPPATEIGKLPYRNYITIVEKPVIELRVGPQPDQPRTIIPIGN